MCKVKALGKIWLHTAKKRPSFDKSQSVVGCPGITLVTTPASHTVITPLSIVTDISKAKKWFNLHHQKGLNSMQAYTLLYNTHNEKQQSPKRT
jgi:hypothetical protein